MSFPQPCSLQDVVDDGVLLKMNQMILHPIGYHIRVVDSEDVQRLVIVSTDDDEGTLYDTEDAPDDVVAMIQKQLNAFNTLSDVKHAKRQEKCGFVVQPIAATLGAATA